MSTHNFAPIPPLTAPPPAIVPALEILTPQWWPIGVAAGTCKFSSSVKYNGFTVALEGHDCGKLVPQVTIPPNNLLLPLILLKSSRKVIFSSFKVRMNGAATACAAQVDWPWMMLSCADPVSMPFTVVLTNMARPVHVGMSDADLAGGLINLAATMAADYITKDVKAPWIKENIKSAIGGAAGYVASDIQHELDPDYPYKGNYTLHLPGGVQFGGELQWGSSDTTRHHTQLKTKTSLSAGVDPQEDPEARMGGVSATVEGTYVIDPGDSGDAKGWTVKTTKKADVIGLGGHTEEAEHKDGKVTTKSQTKGVEGSPMGPEEAEKDTPAESDGELWDML